MRNCVGVFGLLYFILFYFIKFFIIMICFLNCIFLVFNFFGIIFKKIYY